MAAVDKPLRAEGEGTVDMKEILVDTDLTGLRAQVQLALEVSRDRDHMWRVASVRVRKSAREPESRSASIYADL